MGFFLSSQFVEMIQTRDDSQQAVKVVEAPALLFIDFPLFVQDLEIRRYEMFLGSLISIISDQ